MTSELRVTTLSNATGDGPATLTQQRAAKTIFCMNMQGTAALESNVGGAINSSSLTDNGTGDGTVSYTNNMSGRKYAVSHDDTANNTTPPYRRASQVYHNFSADGFNATRTGSLTSSIRLRAYYTGGTGDAAYSDYSANYIVIHGDLA